MSKMTFSKKLIFAYTCVVAIPLTIIVFFIMLVISSFFLLYAIALCKRAKAYYTQKREFEKLAIDETDDVKIEQRTCPHCGDVHDIDYPECPKCKYKFF